MSVSIRSYRAADAVATLDLFQLAVMVTAAGDYSSERLTAWAGVAWRDVHKWDHVRYASDTFVATVNGYVAGFADVSPEGHIAMLYVHPRWARQGVGRRLLGECERRVRLARGMWLTLDASITSRDFFEAHQFEMITSQRVEVRGVSMTNFAMRKELEA